MRNPFLGFDFRRCNRLRQKLKHRCFLTPQQVSQQHHSPVGKFQGIMMRSRVVLVDLPKDGRRVIDHSHLPPEPPESVTPYRGCKGKLCSRKNTNCRMGIFRRSKPDCTGIEVLRSQFLTNLSRRGLYVLQAIICTC